MLLPGFVRMMVNYCGTDQSDCWAWSPCKMRPSWAGVKKRPSCNCCFLGAERIPCVKTLRQAWILLHEYLPQGIAGKIRLRNVDDLQCFLFRHLSGKILVTCIGRLLQPCIILGIFQILTGGFLFVQCTLVSLVHSSLGTVKFFNDDFVLRIDFVFEPRRNFFAGFPLMDNAVHNKEFSFSSSE